MAFSSTVQPIQTPEATQPGNNISDGLLSMIMMAAYAGYMSKKALRKMKRKLAWQALKMKISSYFRTASDRTLLLVILLIVALAILLINPIAALVAALIVLLLYLAGII